MNDLISRQAVMKEFSDFVRRANNSDFAKTPTWNDAVSLVGSLPSEEVTLCHLDSPCEYQNSDIAMPSAQPEPSTEIQEILDYLDNTLHPIISPDNWNVYSELHDMVSKLPPAQPGIIRCKDCIYYDPPHVENNGVRYEYDEMPADAFDALGTGLVNAEYGINIGGRCCVDYYCKHYSDDKRVFVREDNYCGRAERRTDE